MLKAKKEPVDLTKALTLYQITSELQNITNAIMDAGGECDEQTFKALQDWQEEFTVKVEKICHVIESKVKAPRSYFEKVKAAATAEIEKLDRTEKNLRKYILRGMVDTDTKSIKRADGLFSISMVAGRERVEINDSGKLPYNMVDFVEQIKPRTDDIKAALQAGQVVPGAEILIGEAFLTIRSGSNKKENNDNEQ